MCRSTGVAPVILAFAGQVSPDRFILRDVPIQDDPVSPPEHVASLLLTQSRVLDAVATTQEETFKKRQKQKDNPSTQGSLQVGDLVLLSYPGRPPSKLQSKYRGPFKVTTLRGCLAVISSLLVDKIYRVDVSRLKAWKADADPIETARKTEPNVFFPSAIIAHEPHVDNPTTASHYLFMTEWENFEPEDSTWQELKDVKHLDLFRKYLNANKEQLPKCLQRLSEELEQD